VAHTLGGGSPILIVNNQRDGRKAQVDFNAFRAEFKLIGPIEIDLSTRDLASVQRLITEVQHQVCQLPHVGNAISPKWKAVREALQQAQANAPHMPFSDFKKLCVEKHIDRKADRDALSDYLHDLGICLHFKDDEVLKHTVILRPAWATQAVYRVLDDAQVRERFGLFELCDIARVLREADYEDQHDTVLHLMTRFKLCYPIAPTGGGVRRYIAPQLLPPAPPSSPLAAAWPTGDHLWVEYRYEGFMPKGILTRLIVELHERIAQDGEQGLVWKSGVVLQDRSDADTHAQVVEHYGQRKITVRVRGPQRRALWEVVRDRLDSINASYSKPHAPLKVDQLTPCNCSECALKPDSAKYLWRYSELLNHHKRRRRAVPCPIGDEADVQALIDDVFATPDLFSRDEGEVRRQLQQVLLARFSLAELRELCFELGLEADHIASDQAAQPDVVRRLITHHQRRDMLFALRDAVVKARPALVRAG
jgi:hypothetical protein